jgi:hypothetical protein
VIAVFCVLALFQAPRLTVAAGVDRTRLAVGEVLVLTVRVETAGGPPLSWTLPPLAGLALVATHEVTDVSVRPDAGLRNSVRELTLRADRAGTLVIGPIRVRQGKLVAQTKPIRLTVERSAGPAAALAPPARALLDAAPAPARSDQVSVVVLVPSDTIEVGAQLDLLVVAWFPRELRQRLRVQPVLTLAPAVGVWAYADERPDDPVVARLVDGHWMDGYAVHSTVFPLEPGPLVVPAATVDYSVPVSFSIFSREERYSLRSDSAVITVVAPPAGGRPADDQDVTGDRLGLALAIASSDLRVGEPLGVRATVSGIGNVALWPEPELRWPPGFRSYLATTSSILDPDQGRIAGTKTFEYFVVPDSAGAFVLPEVRYPYYDLAARGYVVVRAPPQTLHVGPSVEPHATRAVLSLLAPEEGWTVALVQGLGDSGWLALAALPPLVGLLVLRRRTRPPRPMPAAPPPASPLGRLERDFQSLLASHVPDRPTRDGDGLARALRAAGVERAVADHVMRLRDRVRAARYGPHGVGDAAELAAELRQVMRVLGAESLRRRARAVFLAIAIVSGGAQVGHAQARAEVLYEAGALRSAADSFAARAAAYPEVAAHWYDLGATLYRAGADGKAVVAWTRAARLAPRDRKIAQARALLPLPDAASEQLLAVGPVTPEECAVVAGAAWIAFWAAVVLRRRRIALGALLLCGVAVAGGLREWTRRMRPLAVVLRTGTPVRVAPYGSAGTLTTVDVGAALLVRRQDGPWLAVYREDGIQGWVLASEVARL